MPGDRQPLHNLWRTRDYLRPYRWTYVALVGAGLGATGLAVMIPLIVERVIDGPVLHHDPSGLWQLGALALAFGMLEAGLSFFRRWASSSSSLGMESRIRSDLYRHLQRLPVGFHDGWQSGQLLSRATSDLSAIRRFLTFGLIFLVINTVTYVTVVSLLINMYWPLGLLVAASTVVLWRISHRFTRQYNVVSRRVQDQVGDVASLAEESAGGIRVIKAFRRHDHMESQFGQRARTLRDTAVGKIQLQATTWPRFDLVTNTMLACSLLGGAVAASFGHLTVGQLVAFVTLQLMLIWPVDSLGHIIANAQEAMTAADRIYELLDERPSILDRPRATVLHRESVHAHVRFEGVEFAYPCADGVPGDAAVRRGPDEVLRGVDLEVLPGETLAIVGVTGSGKTTLAQLVPRLADPTAGRITLDGVDIRDVTLESLRSVVGFAFEEATLFSMSVRENLTLGRPDASDAEVEEALEVAQAGFVHRLPFGLETRVGEQGLSLSGGQRQRLALARAVLGKPKLLVLDDPLSALDVHTEALVEEALERVLHDTTAILVVHRPSTVALADRVALLKDGVIAAVGTHSELLATVPAYRDVLSAAESEGALA